MPIIILRIFFINLFFILCFSFYQERGKNDVYEVIAKSDNPIVISVGGIFKNDGNDFLKTLTTKYNIQLNLVPLEVESEFKIIDFKDIVKYPQYTLIGSYVKDSKIYGAIISSKEDLNSYEYIAILNVLKYKKSVNSLKDNQIISDLNTFNFVLKDVKYKTDVFKKFNSVYIFEKPDYSVQYFFFTILIAIIIFCIYEIIVGILKNRDFSIFVLIAIIGGILILFTIFD